MTEDTAPKTRFPCATMTRAQLEAALVEAIRFPHNKIHKGKLIISPQAYQTPVVAVSSNADKRFVAALLGEVARSYILKGSAPEELVNGITAVPGARHS